MSSIVFLRILFGNVKKGTKNNAFLNGLGRYQFAFKLPLVQTYSTEVPASNM